MRKQCESRATTKFSAKLHHLLRVSLDNSNIVLIIENYQVTLPIFVTYYVAKDTIAVVDDERYDEAA